MAVTLKNVAERSGYSLPTVARVLRGETQSHRAEVCERVKQVALEIGYRPNRSASTMRTGTFSTFGLLLSTFYKHSMMPEKLMYGIQDVLNEDGTSLLVSLHGEQELADAAFIPTMLRQLMLDGLIINYHMAPPSNLLSVIKGYSIPSVFVNNNMPFDCVRPDDRQVGYDATQRLITLGHKRIAYITFDTTHYSSTYRRDGYEAAMAEESLAARTINATERELFAQVYELFASAERPTAVIVYSVLAGYVYAAAVKAGLRIPEDLSLIAIEQDVIEGFEHPLTTYLIPSRKMGSGVVEMLKHRVAEPDRQIKSIVIPFTFYDGGTCAQAPRTAI